MIKKVSILLAISCQFWLTNQIKAGTSDTVLKAEVSQWMSSNRSIRFLENKGQMADMQGKPINSLLFKASARGADMYITTSGLSYVFVKMEHHKKAEKSIVPNKLHADNDSITEQYCRADMELVGADIRKENIIKEGESYDRTDYYLGGICPDGIMNVHSYEKLTIKNIYPGIDWVLHTGPKGLKYDFIVHHGADPSLIRLKYKYADKPELQNDGSLVISTSMGNIKEGAPVSYTSDKIKTNYKVENDEVKFVVSKYNTQETLTIDPSLVWATYTGGYGGDEAYCIQSDGTNVWVAASAATTNFPATNPGGGAYYQTTGFSYIMQFTTSGVLKWATYYGGNGADYLVSINSDGTNVWATGFTTSTNFPIQNPLGGAYFQPTLQSTMLGGGNAFILEFSTSGVRKWATYYGGNNEEEGVSIKSDGTNVWVTGWTTSTNFPTLNPLGGAYFQGAIGGTLANAFILQFNTSGVLKWATYYGGNGGTSGNFGDNGTSIYSDGTSVWVTGQATSPNFPLQNLAGAYNQAALGSPGGNIFILKFNTAGVCQWATYYGGSGFDWGNSISSDGTNVWVTGWTYSTNFPTLNPGGGAYFQPANGSSTSAFILQFNTLGVRKWATYYGGTGGFGAMGYSIQSDGTSVWMTGVAGESSFPTYFSGGCNAFNQDTLGIAGTQDMFLLQFTTSGVRKWATFYGVDDENDGTYLSSDGTNLFILGDADLSGYPTINPGGGAYYSDTLTASPNSPDDVLFIGKFCIACGGITATTTTTPVGCKGATGSAKVTPSGGTTPYTYLWKPGNQTTDSITGLSAGTYTVIITDGGGGGCGGADTVYVTVSSASAGIATISATANPPKICEGSSVTLSASATNITSPLTWQPVGLTGASVIITPIVTTTYTVTGWNACDTASSTVTISVNSIPTPAFNSDITTGCSPLCMQFYNQSTISSDRIISYSWQFGNGDSSNNQNPIYCYPNPGIYTVKMTATSDSGCSATLTKDNYITVYTNPKANFAATPQPTTILQPTIQFTDKSTDAYGVAEWNWIFGDASDSGSQSQNTSHTYTDTGTYCANLVVMNTHGCTDSVTNCLVINPIFTLCIPSAFTPNGDGLNEIFIPKGCYIKSFEMYIFDRWGIELFHSLNINNGWNGTYKNTICQEDAYVYVINVYDSGNTKHNYTGTVNLLR